MTGEITRAKAARRLPPSKKLPARRGKLRVKDAAEDGCVGVHSYLLVGPRGRRPLTSKQFRGKLRTYYNAWVSRESTYGTEFTGELLHVDGPPLDGHVGVGIAGGEGVDVVRGSLLWCGSGRRRLGRGGGRWGRCRGCRRHRRG